MKKTKTITAEEIRDAARAEIPALVALEKQFRELYAELRRTPEHRRRRQLEDDDGEAWPLDAAWHLGGTLHEVAEDLREAIASLGDDTSPKTWAEMPAKSKRWAEERKVREAEDATRPKPSTRVGLDADFICRIGGGIEGLAGALRKAPSSERLAELAGLMSEWGAALRACADPAPAPRPPVAETNVH